PKAPKVAAAASEIPATTSRYSVSPAPRAGDLGACVPTPFPDMQLLPCHRGGHPAVARTLMGSHGRHNEPGHIASSASDRRSTAMTFISPTRPLFGALPLGTIAR